MVTDDTAYGEAEDAGDRQAYTHDLSQHPAAGDAALGVIRADGSRWLLTRCVVSVSEPVPADGWRRFPLGQKRTGGQLGRRRDRREERRSMLAGGWLGDDCPKR